MGTKIGHDSPKRIKLLLVGGLHSTCRALLFSERRKAPAHIKFAHPTSGHAFVRYLDFSFTHVHIPIGLGGFVITPARSTLPLL
jgi:hypothetical protein